MCVNRFQLTPPSGTATPEVQPTRRATGARHAATYRILFFGRAIQFAGWALNISRGGFRAVVEERIELGAQFDAQIADESIRRRVHVVWTQEERDGTILGVKFLEPLATPTLDVRQLDQI